MKTILKHFFFFFVAGLLLFPQVITAATKAKKSKSARTEIKTMAKLSTETQACINCHRKVTPGIVEDWLKSLHSHTTPAEGLNKSALERRISTNVVPAKMNNVAVGCYECHSLNPDNHTDNFQHMGYKINVVVSPNDCKACHPVEVEQYTGSKKGHAWKNIMSNPVYHTLVATSTGMKLLKDGKIIMEQPSNTTLMDTCLGCHGTKVEVKGMRKVSTGTVWGDISVPELTNWPSQGVGRENPDGSIGSCSSCHPRHSFSIKVARKPYTCAQCHLDPDVPAWNVYKESKHGGIYDSFENDWDFENVPWVLGKDIKAPTCATCHNSLLVSTEGKVVAQRTHDFGARLWVRLFGLPYSHPQPISGNTTIIKNKDGLPLPTTFINEPATEYLISKEEQNRRLGTMKNICKNCHSTRWTDDHFTKLDRTIKETDEMTLTATKLLVETWEKGIEDRSNPFDEQIEKLWVKHWLFFGNSIKYASAMTGAPDYAAFKNGWWELSDNLQKMRDTIDLKEQLKKKKPESPLITK